MIKLENLINLISLHIQLIVLSKCIPKMPIISFLINRFNSVLNKWMILSIISKNLAFN